MILGTKFQNKWQCEKLKSFSALTAQVKTALETVKISYLFKYLGKQNK